MIHLRSLKHKLFAGFAIMILVFLAFSSNTIISTYFSQQKAEQQQRLFEQKLSLVSELRSEILLTQKDGLQYINFADSKNVSANLTIFQTNYTTAVKTEGILLQLANDPYEKEALRDFDIWWTYFQHNANDAFFAFLQGNYLSAYTIYSTSSIEYVMSALNNFAQHINDNMITQQHMIDQTMLTMYYTAITFTLVAAGIGIMIARVLSGSLLPRIAALQIIATHIDKYSIHQIDIRHVIHQKANKRDELDIVVLAFHETALNLSNTLAFQNALLDNIASDAFLVFTFEGKIVRCNDTFVALFGWEREDVIGKTPAIFFHTMAEYRNMVNILYSQLQQGSKAIFETEILNHSGESIRMELSIKQIPELAMYLLVGKDIRERYAMEQQLLTALIQSEEARKELETIFNTVQDGIALFDLQGKFMQGNDAYEQMFPVNREEAIYNQTPYMFYNEQGDVLSQEELPMIRFLHGEESANPNILRIKRSDNTLVITHSHLSYLDGADDTPIGLLAAVRDITEQYHKNKIVQLMSDISQACAKAIDEESLGKNILEVFQNQPGIEFAGIVIRDTESAKYGRLLTYTFKREEWKAWADSYIKMVEQFAIDPQSKVGVGRVLATGQPLFDMPQYAFLSNQDCAGILPGNFDDIQHIRTTTIPLMFNHVAEGALVIMYDSQSVATDIVLNQDALIGICAEIAHSLNRTHLYNEAQQLALHDPLTGLHNHRSLQQHLRNILEIGTQCSQPVSLIMLDIDNFRTFNEKYGHDMGDNVLRLVAKSIQETIRNADIAARYGGEEFTIILPNTDINEAVYVAERIRDQIVHAQIMTQDGNAIGVTASLGHATFPRNASASTSLIKAADLALYSSKHHGRNRVTAFSTQILHEAHNEHLMPINKINAEELSLPSGADLEAIQALITAIDLRDGYTALHSDSVSRYAVLIGEKLKLSIEEIEILRIGGFIYDVGKIGVPDAILAKDGPLTEEEWVIMRSHSTMGETIVQSVEKLRNLLPLIRWHHERLDGSGYPDGLKGEEIPLLVRIISVADTFDAFTAERRYHHAQPNEDGVRLLLQEAKLNKLDGIVVDAFIEVVIEQSIVSSEIRIFPLPQEDAA